MKNRIESDWANSIVLTGFPPARAGVMTLLRRGTVNKQRQNDRTLDQSFSLVGKHSPTADRAVSAAMLGS
jgi:hypothetical protein